MISWLPFYRNTELSVPFISKYDILEFEYFQTPKYII